MTGGVHSVSQSSGDLKFHLHARIEPEAADRWRKYESERFTNAAIAAAASPRVSDIELSFEESPQTKGAKRRLGK